MHEVLVGGFQGHLGLRLPGGSHKEQLLMPELDFIVRASADLIRQDHYQQHRAYPATAIANLFEL